LFVKRRVPGRGINRLDGQDQGELIADHSTPSL
jgi:hypothetical protein